MNRRLRSLFCVALASIALDAFAQQPTGTPPPQTPPDLDRPEYRSRRLPTDVFRPSEQVQEDTPVPFPEDI